MRLNSDFGKNTVTLDLSNNMKFRSNYFPDFHRSHKCWKILSGKWSLVSPGKFVCYKVPHVTTGENLSITGSKRWTDFIFNVRFRQITQTIRPPEGGVIVYFLFKNKKNFYSFHFSVFKQKIEFIKRYRGNWITEAEQSFNFEIGKNYDISISTFSGFHQCKIDEEIVIKNFNSDIPRGRVGLGIKYCDTEFSQVSVYFPKQSSCLKGEKKIFRISEGF